MVKREALSLAVPLVLLRVRALRSSEQIATIVFTLRAAGNRPGAGRAAVICLELSRV